VLATSIRRILFLVIAVLLTGCNDTVETHYANVGLAMQDHAFERGWLPPVLKPDATDIREWHDIDTNEIRGRFALSRSILKRVQGDCKQVADQPQHLRFAPAWWPETMAGPEKTGNIFRCGNFFVGISEENNEGYFWESTQ
jgi:hypothetical protein